MSELQTLSVNLGARSYPIYIGENILGKSDLLLPHIHGNQIVIISNETIAPLYLDQLIKSVGHSQIETIILPDGEQYKTLATLETIFNQLLSRHCARDTTLIALGGGVVGDIVGFAAACYQRGINFIQVPTTLLAQVDSSVGGKTGVNHPLGKNMIGAFHQPHCVIADTNTLKTLPPRELSAGLAEVVKYGLIADEVFFTWLEKNMARLIRLEKQAVAYAVEQSCRCKAEVVASDELEQSGRRALLNLGHTFGHAIETGLGYGKWLHGEAVACGMVMAAEFSARLEWIPTTYVQRITTLLTHAQLPTKVPKDLSADQFLELMALDKKVKDGKLRLVLLQDIGKAILTDEFDYQLLRTTIADLTQSD